MSLASEPLTLRLAGLADRLAETLQSELDALKSVGTHVAAQMEALARADFPCVEDLTLEIDTAVHRTADLKDSHVRQAGLLVRVATGGTDDEPTIERVIGILRDEPGHDAYADRIQALLDEIRNVATAAERRRSTLEFSLLGAQRVGRSLLGGLHRVIGPATTSVYTSTGAREQAAGGHTLLNRVG